MAVTHTNSEQFQKAHVPPTQMIETTDQHGRVRGAFFKHAHTVVGDIGSTVTLVKLPAGKVRLLGANTWAYVNWTTALADLNAGWGGYVTPQGETVAQNLIGLATAVDVELPGLQRFVTLHAAEGQTVLFESKSGVDIKVSSPQAFAIGDSIAGVLYYIVD